jgi:hypothetical protein
VCVFLSSHRCAICCYLFFSRLLSWRSLIFKFMMNTDTDLDWWWPLDIISVIFRYHCMAVLILRISYASESNQGGRFLQDVAYLCFGEIHSSSMDQLENRMSGA